MLYLYYVCELYYVILLYFGNFYILYEIYIPLVFHNYSVLMKYYEQLSKINHSLFTKLIKLYGYSYTNIYLLFILIIVNFIFGQKKYSIT